MKAAIYARVSTDDQAERQTIDAQLHACRRYCAERGLEVVAEFCDEGVSGTVPFSERPGGRRLLEQAGARMFGVVLVYCPDRLGRDVYEALGAMREFKRLGVPVDFVVHSFDDTPEGVLQFQVLLAIAEYERKNIARRTQNGRYRQARAGKYMAPVTPYGYRRGEDGGLVIDEGEAQVVRWIFDWCVREDQGLVAIAERLNGMGIDPPRHYKHPAKAAKAWHPTTVGKLLRAERYTGKGRYGPETFAYPPLIDAATFQAAQKALARRKQANIGEAKAGYLLSGLVRCRRCGLRCFGTKVGRDRRRAYRCGGWQRGKRQKHGRYYWYADEVESRVRNWLEGVLRDPAVLLDQAALYQEREFARVEQRAMEADRYEARLKALDDEEMRTITWGVKGYLSETQMLAQLDQLRAERAELQARLQALYDEAMEYDPIVLTADFREWLAERLRGLVSFEEGLELVKIVWLEPDGGVTVEGLVPLTDTVFPLS